jgi:hypothetical protein
MAIKIIDVPSKTVLGRREGRVNQESLVRLKCYNGPNEKFWCWCHNYNSVTDSFTSTLVHNIDR